MQIIRSIESRIYTIRDERVMLDFDLASLYEVETKVLNQAVKRNSTRFPDDFMFQLTAAEFENIKSQVDAINQGASSPIVIKSHPNLKSQFVTSSWGGTRKLPYAFTEQGVAMLSGVLKSEKAINMNIAIMRAFVDVRKILLKQNNINEQLTEIKERIGEHDIQLNELYDAMENLIDEKIAQLKWNDRQRIGFKIKE
ncbi:ORF6N domain-containing protein [Pedobacter rhizosphaerae]|uniref:ORF6N domain-containing protein n=1 Tax=Pedobacter rhizosphaerae TaxID=390241 RepID=A0A1H9NTP1_9SPHI|nr:ORF6N domain-containing protein [Pedobacter rhizosphaerae]SER39127.1 ORF6N domain-containing protein [Pedobacter rhizosphaerae]